MNNRKRDYHDFRRPLPQNYVSGFRTKPVPYLRRPEHPLVTISYEFMRLCAAVALFCALAAIAIALTRGAV